MILEDRNEKDNIQRLENEYFLDSFRIIYRKRCHFHGKKYSIDSRFDKSLKQFPSHFEPHMQVRW